MKKDIAIRAKGLGKRYSIGARESYQTLRDALAGLIGAPFRAMTHAFNADRPAGGSQRPSSLIWALRDVSFDVKWGEVVGIIGRNGAGKSTLLKILSRITEPTEGEVEIHGRVGSLLEVGTGFHPDLTGRENVYLNGAILGMKKAEIERKFDEIIAFAEVEKFVDTPLKHYSTGMSMRLAFAVAAHLEPEILLVDEVLAVGDLVFQKKCLGKIGEVATEGRTVLFISHSMAAINRLCRRAIWLHDGKTQLMGSAESVVAAYISMSTGEGSERVWDDPDQAPGDDRIRLRAVRLRSETGHLTHTVATESGFLVDVVYDILGDIPPLRIVIKVATADGTTVFLARDNYRSRWETDSRQPGSYSSRCHVPGELLNAGSYTLTVSAEVPFVTVLFREEDVVRIVIERTGGVGGGYAESWPGIICPPLQWDVRRVSDRSGVVDPVM